jgi:hypothetical protein
MRRLIKSVLPREGFEVVEAVDGLDALEAVERSRIDLVILDLELPRLDRTARRERGKSPGSRRAGLPHQAGSDALPRRPGARRPQTRQQLTGQSFRK